MIAPTRVETRASRINWADRKANEALSEVDPVLALEMGWEPPEPEPEEPEEPEEQDWEPIPGMDFHPGQFVPLGSQQPFAKTAQQALLQHELQVQKMQEMTLHQQRTQSHPGPFGSLVGGSISQLLGGFHE